MKVQVLVCALLCVVAFAAASDGEESTEEMVEVASFVETAADLGQLQEIGTEHVQELDAEGFPVPLTKKQRRTTMEPQYLGEPLSRKKYIVPEYAVPKVKPLNHRKNKPRVFSSHYFSPMPKPKKGGPSCKAGDKKCRRRWKRAAARRRRRNSPLKSVETYNHHLVKNKGFVNPEIIANYPGGPRGDHLARKAAKRGGKPFGLPKKTLAPAPIIKFLEITSQEATDAVDTSAEAEEQGVDEDAEFSEEELDGREQVTVLNGPEQFFEEGFQAPDWADEELAEEDTESDESAAEESEDSEEAEADESADEDAAEADADAEVALIQEADEDEESDESEDEDSEEGEDEEEADEESEDESEEETEEVSLIEASAEADDEDEEEEEDEEEDESNESQEEAMDELEENEQVAEQIDMDASEDDVDQDEEVDDEAEEEAEEDEAQDSEEAETEANEEAVAEMFEVDNHLNDADTLLAEVDAHLTAHADNEAEAESELVKGTPGSSVSAGQTWEDAQNAKLDEMEAHLAAERAATPKFAAKVVAPNDLAAVDAEHQLPEFDQEESEETVETVAPEYAF